MAVVKSTAKFFQLTLGQHQIIEIQNNFINDAIANNDEVNRFIYNLDKAQSYRLCCERQTCLGILNEMLPWTTIEDEISTVNSFICQVNTEVAVLNSELNIGDVESTLSACSPISLRVAHAPKDNSNNNSVEKGNIYFTVGPNPAFDNVDINSNSELYELKIYNLLGTVVYSYIASYNHFVDLNNFSAGAYNVSCIDMKSKVVNNRTFIVNN